MARKMTKVRVHRDKKFLSLSTFTSVFMILISVILIGISSLDLAGVISFRYLDPNWLTNLDLDALLENLPENWNEMENTTIFEYETEYNGTGSLLFRSQSFGDYSKNWLTGQWSWANAPRYDTTGDEIVPQNFYAAKLITQSRVPNYPITVFPKQNLGGVAQVPVNAFSELHPTDDYKFDCDDPSYSFNFYPYDDVPDSIIDEPITNEWLKRHVDTYSTFAKDHYTAIDDVSKAALREYALERGIREDSPTLARDLVRMVKEDNTYPVALDESGNPTLGDYSMKDCPSDMSPIVYFATQYHRGIWTHFAQAAVLFCRSFGIPARYVSGYRENVNDPENAIGIKEIWNWSEVWHDNAGWVPYDPGISLNLSVRADQMTGGISGMIGKGQGETPNDTPVAMFTIAPDPMALLSPDFSLTDPIYFRYASYGDYSRSLWGEAPKDERANDGYDTPTNFWMGTSARMMGGGIYESALYIQGTPTLKYALTPSYSVSVDEVEATYFDDHVSFEAEPQIIQYEGVDMSIYAYSYPYFTRNANPLQIKLRGYDVFADPKYDQWVKENFLNYEDPANPALAREIEAYILENHINIPLESDYTNINNYYTAKDAFWDDINERVNRMAESVYYAATLPDGEDPVLYLLRDSETPKTANHTMLASAEVLLLRALGVPARYVSGFVGKVGGSLYGYDAPTSGILTGANGYAWCEAYEEGIGWRRLDPTSAISIDGQEIVGPGEMDDSDRYIATPAVRDITTFYDGKVPDYIPTPLTHSPAHPEIAEGDTVYFDPVAADFVKKDVGEYIGLFKARVVDVNGKDVTSSYRIPNQYSNIKILKRPVVLNTPDRTGHMGEGYGPGNPFTDNTTFNSMLMEPTSYFSDGEEAYEAYLAYQASNPQSGSAPFRLSLAVGDHAVINERPSLTYATTVDYTVKAEFYDNQGDRVTDNYDLDYYKPRWDDELGRTVYEHRPGRLTLTD